MNTVNLPSPSDDIKIISDEEVERLRIQEERKNRKLNILIADDAVFMRYMLTNMIQAAGHNVVGEAVDGADAFQKYQLLKPELTFLDITMPDVTGLEALEKIKQYDPKAIVVMCSAMGQKKHVMEAIRLGAQTFIVKPVSKEKVLEAIDDVVALLNRKQYGE